MTAMAQTSSDAWADVLGTYRGDLVRTARSRLGSGGADAEDVVHDVVVRVLRGRREAGEMATPGAYLRRAVGNECVSRWRRTSREVMVAELPDRPRPAPDEAVLDRLALSRGGRHADPAAASGDRADRARRPAGRRGGGPARASAR